MTSIHWQYNNSQREQLVRYRNVYFFLWKVTNIQVASQLTTRICAERGCRMCTARPRWAGAVPACGERSGGAALRWLLGLLLVTTLIKNIP